VVRLFQAEFEPQYSHSLIRGLQFPSLITPATLLVIPSTQSLILEAPVASLDITNSSESHRFAYSPPMNATDSKAIPASQNFDGPRTILTRLTSSTASFGEVLRINPPFDHSSYTLNFSGPYVTCSSANSTVQAIVDSFLQNRNATLQASFNSSVQEIMAYYAFVPSFDVGGENATSVFFNGSNITALDQPRLQQQSRNATNELWMKFWRYETDSHGDQIPVPQYSQCSLWNASYSLTFLFENGGQTISNNSIILSNPVAYPTSDPNQPSDLVQHSYSALFWVLTDQLVGSMSFFISNTPSLTPNLAYASIDTQIEHNSILGSNDLDYFFHLNKQVYGSPTNGTLSDQRLQDKALAQNQTLPFLVEQLAFNITVSLMHDPLLA
jgi:hypothetical protein